MSSMKRIADCFCEKYGHEITVFSHTSHTPNDVELLCRKCGMTLSEIRDVNPVAETQTHPQ